MLQNAPFYWGTNRKLVGAFGSIFSDIHIVRTDADGNPTKTIYVPCEYGPKEKWLVRAKQNPMPGVDDMVEMVLPRMSYQITGFTYDQSRQLPATGRNVKVLSSDQKAIKAQFNPVPYNVGFNLDIMVKNFEDGLMIIEQILPFFAPDYTINLKTVPELDLTHDIRIVLNSVQHDDQDWEGNMQTRRSITWTLSFTAKSYMYPPVALQKVILDSTVTVNKPAVSSRAYVQELSTVGLGGYVAGSGVLDVETTGGFTPGMKVFTAFPKTDQHMKFTVTAVNSLTQLAVKIEDIDRNVSAGTSVYTIVESTIEEIN